MSEDPRVKTIEAGEPATPLEGDELFLQHSGWLSAILKRRYGPDASDILHETYLRVAPGNAAVSARSPKAFMLRVATNLAIDRLRRGRREYEAVQAAFAFTENCEYPPVDRLMLKQALLGLPPKLRDVLILRHIRGLTYDEIARAKGISVKTVEWRMRKAVAACAARLGD